MRSRINGAYSVHPDLDVASEIIVQTAENREEKMTLTHMNYEEPAISQDPDKIFCGQQIAHR